ncbi:MAG: class I SAM-dependent methyltransferase [Candidatus Latescibacterota bacterium]|nr:MAG: class I SAM-dependent methyltransferase [Candidatus Latescibacterota bacterium]
MAQRNSPPQRLEGARRFDDRVENYARYRPDYPPEIVHYLEKQTGLQRGARIADVGSGTGKLAETFLHRGYRVIGVEPSAAMRVASARALASQLHFRVVAGRAEQLPLHDRCVDAIVAGQAFHWFDPERARSEFRRALRSWGRAILVWNNRKDAESGLLPDYEAMLRRHCPDYPKVGNKHFDEAELVAFFGDDFESARFDNCQELDLVALRGRLLSSSYVPASGLGHDAIMEELEALFARYARGGRVTIDYDTVLFHGSWN